MATNPTNSTSVNITSLPKAQLAVPTDYLILQTNNGSQIVSFSSFNVVKTDINGNATIVGSVTGNAAQFTNTRVASISSSRYCTSNGTPGITLPVIPGREYYDSFTIVNGLITSAVPTSVDYLRNPIYTSLYTQLTAASAYGNSVTQTQIGALTAATQTQILSLTAATQTQVSTLTANTQTQISTLSGLYSTYIQQLTSTNIISDTVTSVTILANALSAVTTFQNFFAPDYPTSWIPLASITPWKFTIMPFNDTQGVQLSSVPYIRTNSIARGGGSFSNDLSAALCIGSQHPLPTNFYVRLLVTA